MQLLSADNKMALDGSAAYGTSVQAATFDPPCDAYRAAEAPGSYSFAASSAATGSTFSLEVFATSSYPSKGPMALDLPLSFFKNVTNQASFANGTSCSNMIRLFDQSLFADGRGSDPRPVSGLVAASGIGPLDWSPAAGSAVREVAGIQVATPFAENNYIDCRTLQGLGAGQN